jgi:hypothetical protein
MSHATLVNPRDGENPSCSTVPVSVIYGFFSSNLPATFNSSARAFWISASKLVLSGGEIVPAARQSLSKHFGPWKGADIDIARIHSFQGHIGVRVDAVTLGHVARARAQRCNGFGNQHFFSY